MLVAAVPHSPARPTRRCSRPLRARDRSLFDRYRKRLRQLNGKPLGGWAAWLSDLFGHLNRSGKRALVVPKLVVLIARCAGVVRRLVMLLARCVQPDRVLSVIPTERPLCWRDCVQVWYDHAGSSRA